MRNEFVYFTKSIPRWITVDAPDSRCIKAATDKFPPAKRKKRPSRGDEDGFGRSLHPDRLVSGDTAAVLDRPSSRDRVYTRVHAKKRRRSFPRALDGGLISSHWPALTASTTRDNAPEDCTLLFIFTRRGINLRLSRIQPAYAESMGAYTFAHRLRTRRAWFVTDNARSSLNLTSLRADRPLRTQDRRTTNLYCK